MRRPAFQRAVCVDVALLLVDGANFLEVFGFKVAGRKVRLGGRLRVAHHRVSVRDLLDFVEALEDFLVLFLVFVLFFF